SCSPQIIALSRYNVPDAAARVVHIALIPRNHMRVQVEHCLSRGFTDVNTNVESAGLVRFGDHCTNSINRLDDLDSFLWACLKPARYVSSRDYQSVSPRDREPIPNTKRRWRFKKHSLNRNIAEGTFIGGHAFPSADAQLGVAHSVQQKRTFGISIEQ